MTNNNIRRYGGTIEGAFVRQRTYAANEQRATHAVSKSGMDNYHMLEEVIQPAELSHNPRSLQGLWREYKEGLNGRKPAEQFTTAEVYIKKELQCSGGGDGYIMGYHIQRMVNAGRSAEYAIKRMHQV